MIAFLRGAIFKKTDREIILECGNIGYFIFLTKNTLSQINENEEKEFFIHQNLREDSSELYGFITFEELIFFKNLININGIGPKVALEILNFPKKKIIAAICNDDTEFICKIPGIGAKTAKRIILELKDKIDAEPDEEYQSPTKEIDNDIIEALQKFGYQKHKIKKILKRIPQNLKKAEDIISYALKHI